MLIIKVEASETRQHHFESQSHRTKCWLDGYVTVPPEREADVMGCSGFGELTVDGGKFVDFTPHPEWIPVPKPEEESSVYDELAAAYTEGVNSAYEQ